MGDKIKDSTLTVDGDLRIKVKIVCAKLDVKMKKFVKEALEEKIERLELEK